MKLGQIACQLYTLRDHLKEPRDIARTLARVRALGFGAVELSGLGPVDDAELAKMLRGEGLACCATHEPGEKLLAEPRAVIDRLRVLDCTITSYPWPGGLRWSTPEDVQAFAAQLDASGKVFHGAGITFCYHNHHMEFQRIAGRTVLERLYDQTNPLHLQAELDTYWVQFGGGDPAGWCRRMKGRLAVLHMKDYAVTPDHQVAFAEVGSGNLDWPAIVAAADEAGCRWFAIEQDVCPGDPFESLKRSYEFVREKLCRG
jgi:sugar phosphate isomerase/epimerase